MPGSKDSTRTEGWARRGTSPRPGSTLTSSHKNRTGSAPLASRQTQRASTSKRAKPKTGPPGHRLLDTSNLLRRTIGSRSRRTPPMRHGGHGGPLVACPARNLGCHQAVHALAGPAGRDEQDRSRLADAATEASRRCRAITPKRRLLAGRSSSRRKSRSRSRNSVTSAGRERDTPRARRGRCDRAAGDGVSRRRLLAQGADAEHRQRRHPGPGPPRQWPAERHQARMDKGMYSFMRRMLASEAGHALYKHRKATVEPVSAQIKFNRKINHSNAEAAPPRYRNGGWSRPRTT